MTGRWYLAEDQGSRSRYQVSIDGALFTVYFWHDGDIWVQPQGEYTNIMRWEEAREWVAKYNPELLMEMSL